MRLQKMLASLGYLTAAPTGYFGPLTKAAVMKYQGDHGLQGVGLVGPLTRALLNGSGGASMFATSSPAVSPSNAPSVTFSSTLTLGSTGSDVKALQVFLNAQGFKVASSGAGSPGNETTYFGNATKSALMKFQLAHKAEILDSQRLTAPTGFFGTATMKVVNGMMKSQ
jgi:peptidoglycan hydrolase-like protein with peptidoglycan-binding domain